MDASGCRGLSKPRGGSKSVQCLLSEASQFLVMRIPRLILRRPGVRIVIGVLVAFDSRQAIGRKHLVRLLFFELGDLSRPRNAALDAYLDFRLDPFGLVQAADGNVEVV